MGGFRVAPFRQFKNVILNGNFNLWNNGTSFSNQNSTIDIADKWKIECDSAEFSVARKFVGSDNGVLPIVFPFPEDYYTKYYTNLTLTFGTCKLTQRINSVRHFVNKYATLSFYAKVSSYYETTDINLSLIQNFGTGDNSPSQEVVVETQTITLQNQWKKFSNTFLFPDINMKTIGNNNDDHIKLEISFPHIEVFDIARIQLEEGSFGTLFEHKPLVYETLECQ